jgi:2-phosphosulfolactate phosphatase
MRISTVHIPAELSPEHLRGRTVVVFDVLRATTTIATAMNAGAKEIRVFGSLDSARAAAGAFGGELLLCGERECLKPEGFDLGNSPVEYSAGRVSGRTLFLSTTNGTKAVVAAEGAAVILTAALVNARATAEALHAIGRDVTLLCAGTNGRIAPEDIIGAGAVADNAQLLGKTQFDDATNEAVRLFHNSRGDLPVVLRATDGGHNIVKAGLERDILAAAGMDSLDVVVEISGNPPVARRMIRS